MMAVVAGCVDGGERSARDAQEAGYAAFARRKAVTRVSGKSRRRTIRDGTPDTDSQPRG
jgi:hypothetical protein